MGGNCARDGVISRNQELTSELTETQRIIKTFPESDRDAQNQ